MSDDPVERAPLRGPTRPALLRASPPRPPPNRCAAPAAFLRHRILGNLGLLPPAVQRAAARVMHETRLHDGGVVNICMSYTGREDMLQAALACRRAEQQPVTSTGGVVVERAADGGDTGADCLMQRMRREGVERGILQPSDISEVCESPSFSAEPAADRCFFAR